MAEEKILKKQIEIVFLLVTKNREVERGECKGKKEAWLLSPSGFSAPITSK